jgi:hypothetical protein
LRHDAADLATTVSRAMPIARILGIEFLGASGDEVQDDLSADRRTARSFMAGPPDGSRRVDWGAVRVRAPAV